LNNLEQNSHLAYICISSLARITQIIKNYTDSICVIGNISVICDHCGVMK